MVGEKIVTDIISFHTKIWSQLQKIHLSKQVGNAYLFFGPPGCGKEGIAIQFAQLLNCEDPQIYCCNSCSSCKRFSSLQHQNLKLIFPLPIQKKTSGTVEDGIGGKELDLITESIVNKSKDPFFKIKIPKANRIPIQSIRSLRKSLYLKTEKFGRQIVIVFDSHLLSEGQGESGNAFLKLLEEPPDRCTIILVSDYSELLLPTIISRCQKIRFSRLTDDFINKWLKREGVQKEALKLLTSLSRGNIHQARFSSSQSLDDLVILMDDLVKLINQEDPKRWRSFIQTYSKLANQNYVKFSFHFFLMKIWFYSANKLMKNLDDILHTTSLKPGMVQIITRYPNADFSEITFQLEKVLRAKSQNRYMPLVLITFLINIQKYLKK